MTEIFAEIWRILFNQPSQSPVTNAHDACIFPMMSKAVSTVHALEYVSMVLKDEEFYHAVKSVWDNPANRVSITRVFTGHHQIACSIIEHEGDNQYLVDKSGLSLGIRQIFDPDENEILVMTVSLAARGK